MRRYLPATSFIGYFRRCECSVMPCSRTLAPLAQCAPRLIGESNTGSWRTHTPSVTTASMAQPTEQWVQTVRFTTVLPGFFAWAWASPTRFNGSWLANAAAPAAMPLPLKNVRRSTVFAPSADAARKSGLTACAAPSDLRVSNMAASSDFGGLVVLQDMRGGTVCRGLRIGRRRLGRGELHLVAGSRDGRDGSGASQSRGEQEFTAGCAPGGFHTGPPHGGGLAVIRLRPFALRRGR